MLTGLSPADHGIVANGFYDRELAEILFWKQSNKLVQGEKVWETARKKDLSVTTLNMFWWFNMVTTADYSVTPRPIYKADGRKIPDCYTNPPHLRDMLQDELGRFPLFSFWGPAASIESTRWITSATLLAHEKFDPTLTLVYLPHLDYPLQRLGPDHADIPEHLALVDAEVARLLDYFHDRNVRTIILSEYGIEPVENAIHINRHLRQHNCLSVREEQGGEILDTAASDAFAVADHQIAHLYMKDPAQTERIADLCRQLPGVEHIYGKEQMKKLNILHPRSGDLLLVADRKHWFSYYYWLDDRCAPDFARTVDIHRKPGYDPCELIIDPKRCCPKLQIAWKLLKSKLRLRTLFDLIPLDASLVGGSHGRCDQPESYRPVIITQNDYRRQPDQIPPHGVKDIILDHLFT